MAVELASKYAITTIVVLLLCCVYFSDAGKDFYKMLDVKRTSSTREIRMAFKKMALIHHPDKNRGDPEAHNKFVKINRAYEVLKDESLRKIYNEKGEQGLADKDKYGNEYQNWNFYKNDFGIYDEDKEIMTMNRNDFEQLVKNTNDLWFVNFYSPRCSHCHELAPTWREVAKDMEGVVRIAAINCNDEWQLCNEQPFTSFPSIMQFPKAEKYMGDKTKELLIEFMLREAEVMVDELDFENDLENVQGKLLVTYCGIGGLIRVSSINCELYDLVCSQHKRFQGTVYYKYGLTSESVEIESLQSKEIIETLLKQLPSIREISAEVLEQLSTNQNAEPWLVHFTNGEHYQPELRMIGNSLEDINFGRVDCSLHAEECRSLDAAATVDTPTFAMIRPRGLGRQLHYGRLTVVDVAAFAQSSLLTPSRALTTADFPSPVTDAEVMWYVMFLTKDCGPCTKLLAEFRKASRMTAHVHFGTVDCDLNGNICEQYGVESYPTVILFNVTKPVVYTGEHTAAELVDFIEEVKQPSVLALTSTTFEQEVLERAPGTVVLVMFALPSCGPCIQIAPEWRKLAKMHRGNAEIIVASINCELFRPTCNEQSVQRYPSFRVYKLASDQDQYEDFNNWVKNANEFYSWSINFVPKISVEMDDDKFNRYIIEVTKARYWVVNFYTSGCNSCVEFAAKFRSLAQKLHEKSIKTAMVDCNHNEDICSRAEVQQYPTLVLYMFDANVHEDQRYIGITIDNGLSVDEIFSEIRKVVGKNRKRRKAEL